MVRRGWPWWLLGAFLLAFALRVGLTAASQGLSTPQRADANPDAVEYVAIARNLAEGRGYRLDPAKPTAARPPGTPALLLPACWLFGDSVVALRLWNCAISAAVVPLVMQIGRRIFDHRVGILAGLLLAITPAHWYYAFHFLSELPTGLTTLLGAWLAWEAAKSGSWKVAFSSGVAWGCAILVRPNMLLAAAATALALLVLRSLPAGHRWRCALQLSAGVALVVLPWVVRNRLVIGQPTICTVVAGATFYGANNAIAYDDPQWVGYWWSVQSLDAAEPPVRRVTAQPDEPSQDRFAQQLGLEYAKAHANRLPTVLMHRLLRVLWAYPEYPQNKLGERLLSWSWFLLLPFFAYGFVRLWLRSPETGLLLSPALAAVVATAVLFYGCSRFRDALIPLLSLIGAFGAVELSSPVFGRRGQPSGADSTPAEGRALE